ncbi:cyclic nucleotide-binding domain-containing protein [Terasakiella sp. A23]|uniref:Crp/Fnr family transcriptional regulator n=1 Tax=Terasakiella sp. FCG-A23 TaxID=3080561 RepID=UPI002954CA10|nr:cyclic nucleotide-binding domain-containing protein [Terasakiella sp. A23]MDV7340166.1 cyclic nucleotide-binding domain-containing protein [Terasakiella sp. A23]
MSSQQLAGLPVLNRLKPEVLQPVFEKGTLVNLEGGTVFCHEDEPANSVFWMISGRCKTFVTLQDHEIVVDILSRKGKIGLVEVCEGSTYCVSAQAIEDSLLFKLAKDDFQELLSQYFGFQMAVFANISGEMRGAVKEINDLKLKNTSKRLGTFLMGMTNVEEGSVELELPYDKRLLAARLAMKPESLSRALSKLRPVGLETDRNIIRIKDLDLLRDFCGEEDYE